MVGSSLIGETGAILRDDESATALPLPGMNKKVEVNSLMINCEQSYLGNLHR